MKFSKIQFIWILLLGFFIFPNNTYAQQGKKIVIVIKTMDKDGNETIEKIVKKGAEAESFDIPKYLKKESVEGKEINVEVVVEKEKAVQNEKQEMETAFFEMKNGEIVEEVEVTIDEDGNEKKEIRITKTKKREAPFFGVKINPQADHLKILSVVKGSPAEKSGLVKGDIIKRINSQNVNSFKEFSDELAKYKKGEVVSMVIDRDGGIDKIRVVFE